MLANSLVECQGDASISIADDLKPKTCAADLLNVFNPLFVRLELSLAVPIAVGRHGE